MTGGTNVLSFSPTTFGVTFNAGTIQGQLQSLDSSNQHFLGVTGVFQTVVGTSFSDTLTAALPTFNSGVIGPGTTIFSGLGQDTIYGTLGTKAQTDGSGSSYTQVLSADAVNELKADISMFGGSPDNLGGFESSITANAGLTAINISLLTNVTLNGTQNTFNQFIDANSAQVLKAAIASFGGSSGAGSGGFGNELNNLGGFGNNLDTGGGFDLIETSILTNVHLTGGNNLYIQALDANSAQVLETAIASFGGSINSGSGGFGNNLDTGGGFGNNLDTGGGFNQVQTSLMTGVNLGGRNNTYIQSLDTNSAQVLEAAIASFGGSSGAGAGGFGNELNTLGGFGNNLDTGGGFDQIQTSILTTVNLTGGNNLYIQALDVNSAQVLEAAIAGFGGSINSGIGGFGNNLDTGGGFGNNLDTGGGFNQVQTSLITSVNLGGGNNTYIQSLDANSAQVLESAIASFGGSLNSGIGGFGGQLDTLGGFGNNLDIQQNPNQHFDPHYRQRQQQLIPSGAG